LDPGVRRSFAQLVGVLADAGVAGLRELELLPARDLNRLDEPLVLEPTERLIDRARARLPYPLESGARSPE